MSFIRSFIGYFNERSGRCTIYDVKLLQGVGILIGLILAQLIPALLNISVWWFVGLLIILIIRPFYLFFIRK
ncbi:MAG: hypothetical protein CVT49_03360 [candidate division Zixibacteria bacterium HGW-Zixibacteria-1]|nr:MAG: hypothetical protein CVT49_03360 [candidate division Zixibacteria bacterium HGW-Zixibacteria-1]